MNLTDTQKKLAEQLLITVINNEPYIEYNDLAIRVNPPVHAMRIKKELAKISELCNELGLPLLSAKVVGKKRELAITSFYNLLTRLEIDTEGKTEDELFLQEIEKINSCTEWYTLADNLGLTLDLPRPAPEKPEGLDGESETTETSESVIDLGDLPDDVNRVNKDGLTIIVNSYERNPATREACISHFGTACAVCEFDFGLYYGDTFKEEIHIHLTKPLYLIDDTYEIDPINDFVPVCPNCHLILHSKKDGVYSVAAVRAMIDFNGDWEQELANAEKTAKLQKG